MMINVNRIVEYEKDVVCEIRSNANYGGGSERSSFDGEARGEVSSNRFTRQAR